MHTVSCLKCYFLATVKGLEDDDSTRITDKHSAVPLSKDQRGMSDPLSFFRSTPQNRILHCYRGRLRQPCQFFRIEDDIETGFKYIVPYKLGIADFWETITKTRNCNLFHPSERCDAGCNFDFLIAEQGRKNEPTQTVECSTNKVGRIRLASQTVSFVTKHATIKIGKKVIQLSPDTIQDCFCRMMFKPQPGRWISWDIISEKISGEECNKPTERDWRIIYDAMRQINRRVKKDAPTEDDLFSWRNMKVKRNF